MNELTCAGVPPQALDAVRAGYVLFDEFGFEFEHHDRHGREGVRSFLFLVTDRQGAARDVVAWTPQDGRVTSWLNRAWALGEEKVFTRVFLPARVARVAHAPRLAPANGKGICLVRPQVAAHYLDCAGPLLAEDAVHGAELKRA